MALSNVDASGLAARRTGATPTLAWAVLVVVALVAGTALFGESLVAVVSQYARPEFSHGYIIPLISAWILWQRRTLIWQLRRRGSPSGWLLVAAGVGVAFVSKAATLVSTPYLGLIIALIGFAAVTLGWAAARLLIVPIGFLAFGFPLPTYAYVEVSTSLQLVSSQLGAGMLDLWGVPVYLDGNIIDLGVYKLQVAEACSGLRYLLPLLSFGVLCAFMYRAPLWAKLLVVATTVPLTIVLNSARIAMTGLFVHYGTEELAQGFMHLFEGWVIFLLALAVLFALMFGLLRLLGWRGRLSEMLDFDRMAGTPNGRVPPAPPGAPAAATVPETIPRPLTASVATSAVAALLLVPIALRPQVEPVRPGLFNFPLQVGDWLGTPQSLDPEVEEVLGADDHLLIDFVHRETDTMTNVWVAYYGNLLRDARVLHLPTTCLPGAGWEYIEFRRWSTPLRNFTGAPLTVNRGVIVKGTQRLIMYFWMELRGRSRHQSQYIKLDNLRDSLLTGRSDGALVRVFTPLAPGEDPADGDRRLISLLERVYPHLQPHIGR